MRLHHLLPLALMLSLGACNSKLADARNGGAAPVTAPVPAAACPPVTAPACPPAGGQSQAATPAPRSSDQYAMAPEGASASATAPAASAPAPAAIRSHPVRRSHVSHVRRAAWRVPVRTAHVEIGRAHV